MGESRAALLAWVNDLLQLNYTKIEQLGTGAAYCQILDSIYGDVPLSKVKFEAKQEYEYLSNFKVLQTAFIKHKIDKSIAMEKLCKCRFQDNLDFLQWFKRFYDDCEPGSYDPVRRRQSILSNGTLSPGMRSRGSITPSYQTKTPDRSNSRTGRNGVLKSGSSTRFTPSSEHLAMVEDLRHQVAEMQSQMETLERERDFYYNKLRMVEELAGQDINPEESAASIVRALHSVLYGTEDGFVDPDDVDQKFAEMHLQEYDDDDVEDETF
ncbi:EB1 domain protein [Basidiobolus meristosporus CBS 931.73]|uniref:EB1 domain protein n=1 Tax=Basidiobolus meristosporus CBS 931.73 TaxID=1314790 RepID=A0A1Y1Y726_9FUNG|nr:EB1 domain protein [Basidiobolus meristosporus CBS 931.73]|eukprot:ORX93812.1 EB1 domain protein [Basidiobolus meristosporus CBS 931.73]